MPHRHIPHSSEEMAIIQQSRRPSLTLELRPLELRSQLKFSQKQNVVKHLSNIAYAQKPEAFLIEMIADVSALPNVFLLI